MHGRFPVSPLIDPTADAVLSDSLTDLMVPGVLVEMDASEAESLGAFEETALTESDAWDANADLIDLDTATP
jgi:type IV secretion system protein VirB1